MSQTNTSLLYEEKQRFTLWWMWLIILLPLGIGLYGCYVQFFLQTPFGDKPMSNTGLLIFTLFGFGFAYFFWMNRLTTQVTEEGLRIQFFPYVTRTIGWGEIDHCRVMPYSFVGGWGVRLWTQYGTVYNVKSGQGLFVQLKNKKKCLVGTQRPEELKRLLQQLEVSRELLTE